MKYKGYIIAVMVTESRSSIYPLSGEFTSVADLNEENHTLDAIDSTSFDETIDECVVLEDNGDPTILASFDDIDDCVRWINLTVGES